LHKHVCSAEEEQLNHLYEERIKLIEHLSNADAAGADDPVSRQRLTAVRAEIKVIEAKQATEKKAAEESQRIREQEQQATQKRLENAAAEEAASKGKKAALDAELIAMRDRYEFEKGLAAEMKAEADEFAMAEQLLRDQRLAGKIDEQNNIRQINALEIEAAREKSGYIMEIEEQQHQEQIARGEQAFSTMVSNMAAHNKTFFKIQKLYRLSKLAMEAPAAIADSYAWGASWGGPPAGAAMAAIAGTAMAGYAAQLTSAQYGGGARRCPGHRNPNRINTGREHPC